MESTKIYLICRKTNEHALTIGRKYELLKTSGDWGFFFDDKEYLNSFPLDCFNSTLELLNYLRSKFDDVRREFDELEDYIGWIEGELK